MELNVKTLNKSIDKIRAKDEKPAKKDVQRLNELEEIIAKGKFKEGLDLEKQDYDDVARQISQRIRGTPDGKLPYDWKLGEGSKNFATAGTKLRGPLRERVFNIPDAMVEEFLENDIEKLGARYLRQIAADTELSRAFDGDVEMKHNRGPSTSSTTSTSLPTSQTRSKSTGRTCVHRSTTLVSIILRASTVFVNT